MNVIDKIMQTAQKNHGIELQPYTVRNLASTLVAIDREMIRLQNVEMMFEAYLNEYGEDLMKELNSTMEAMIAEVVDSEFEEQGQEDEVDGVHAPLAEGTELSLGVPEIPDEG